jgi:hypothetical protein
MLDLIFSILFHSTLLLPACYYLLLQWNEKKFRWNWVGVMFILFNLGTFWGSALNLWGEHNVIYFSEVRLISSLFIVVNLPLIERIKKGFLVVLLPIIYFTTIHFYPDETGLYVDYTFASLFLFVIVILVLFYDLFRLINLNRSNDLRSLPEFWTDLGAIIYLTWMSYDCLLLHSQTNTDISVFFLFFGNATGAVFFMISLNRWARNKKLRSIKFKSILS